MTYEPSKSQLRGEWMLGLGMLVFVFAVGFFGGRASMYHYHAQDYANGRAQGQKESVVYVTDGISSNDCWITTQGEACSHGRLCPGKGAK